MVSFNYQKRNAIIKRVAILCLVVVCFSCGEGDPIDLIRIKSSFIEPFPKKSKNLTRILGDEFVLKNGDEIKAYAVGFRKSDRYNFIIDKTRGDTLFAGPVSKFRGLYYFSHQLKDSTYYIYAVDIKKGTITGLFSMGSQMLAWDDRYDYILDPDTLKYPLPVLVSHVNLQTSDIFLIPDKKGLRAFYEEQVATIEPDTFVSAQHTEIYTDIDSKVSMPSAGINSMNYIKNDHGPELTYEILTDDINEITDDMMYSQGSFDAPEFPGGMDSLSRFLKATLSYPKSALRDSISGNVYTRFIVNTMGDVEQVEILKGVHKDLDSVCIGAIRSMPKWTPGKSDNSLVKVAFTLPVYFRIPEKSTNSGKSESLPANANDTSRVLKAVNQPDRMDYIPEALSAEVYPNPAVSYCNVKLNKPGSCKYRLFDMHGRIMKEGELRTLITKIDLEGLQRGNYYFRIFKNSGEQLKILRVFVN